MAILPPSSIPSLSNQPAVTIDHSGLQAVLLDSKLPRVVVRGLHSTPVSPRSHGSMSGEAAKPELCLHSFRYSWADLTLSQRRSSSSDSTRCPEKNQIATSTSASTANLNLDLM